MPLEVVIQSGHLGPIRALAYSPDGCYIASAGDDHRLKIWDERSGKEYRSVTVGAAPHVAATFSADSASLTGAAQGIGYRTWRLANGAATELVVVDDLQAFAQRGALTASVDREQVVLRRGQGRERVLRWNVNSAIPGELSAHNTQKKKHQPIGVALDPRGEIVASTGAEGRTVLWQVDSGVAIRSLGVTEELGEQAGFIQGLSQKSHLRPAFSADGRYLATAQGGVVSVWRVATGARHLRLTGHRGAVQTLAFSNDRRLLASGDGGGHVIIWSVRDGKKLAEHGAHNGGVTALQFKPRGDVACGVKTTASDHPLAGRVLVSGGEDHQIKIWSLEARRLLRALKPKVQPLNDIAFSPDGRSLAIASSALPNGSTKIWRLDTGYEITGIPFPTNALDFNPVNGELALAGVDRQVKLLSADLRAQRVAFAMQGRGLLRYVLQSLFVVAAARDQQTLKFLGAIAANSALDAQSHDRLTGVRDLRFSPSGDMLVVAGQSKTAVWREGREELEFLKHNDMRAVEVTGDFVVQARVNSFRRGLDDLQTEFRFPESEGMISAVRALPDGQTILQAHARGRLALRSLATGEEIRRRKGYGNLEAVAVSPDGRLAAVGGSGGFVEVLTLPGLEPRYRLQGHEGTVFGIDFSPDGQRLATASADGTARLWDLDAAEPILTFVSVGTDDFVLLTPDNFYMASTNGHQGIAFRVKGELFPFEQFDLQLNRPDIVLARLGTVPEGLLQVYAQARRKRLAALDLTEAQISLEQPRPRLWIENPPMSLVTDRARFALDLRARSLAGLARLQVWVNDVPLPRSQLPAVAGTTLDAQVPLVFSRGRNKVQVAVVDKRGMESLRRTFEVVYLPEQDTKRDLHIVSVGVSDYAGQDFDLGFAAKDARDLVRELERQQRRYARINSHQLLDAGATTAQIRQRLTALRTAHVDDDVVVFLAGHGVLDAAGEYRFATADFDFSQPEGQGLTFTDIDALLQQIPSRHKVMLIDSCHSGSVDPALVPGRADIAATSVAAGVTRSGRGVALVSSARDNVDSFYLMQQLFAGLGRGSGTTVISAAAGDEFAFENDQYANGLFTYAVLDSLRSLADKHPVRVSELKDAVHKQVRFLSGGQQTPNMRRVNLEFDYHLYSRRPIPDEGPVNYIPGWKDLFRVYAGGDYAED
ncbi:MAG: caspase family protein [Pseudomonadota bacterium]